MFNHVFQAWLDAQVLGYTPGANPAIQFFVPVINSAFLVIQAASAVAFRFNGLLQARRKFQILLENAVKILNALIPQGVPFTCSPIR